MNPFLKKVCENVCSPVVTNNATPSISDIGGNLLARFSAAESDFSLVGNEIALWVDIGSRSYDAVGHETDGTKRPLYLETGWDGVRPCVSFDGINDYLVFPAIPNTNGTEVFIVAKTSNLVGNRAYLGASAAGGPNIVIDSVGKIRFNRQSQAVLCITPSAITTSPYVINAKAKYPTNFVGLYLNGITQQTAAVAASFTSGYTTIGAVSAGGTFSFFLEGSIAEILIYDGNLTDTQRKQIERFLRVQWGIL